MVDTTFPEGVPDNASYGYGIHEVIFQRAADLSSDIAVFDRNRSLSYDELVRRAGILAHRIAPQVGPESRVGICLEREPRTVVGMLAVLAAGGACVPLDPGYPTERLSYMIADSGCSLVLTDSSHRCLVAADVPTLDLDDAAEQDAIVSTKLPRTVPDQLAMVLYTSGSTGPAKGVMITHRGVVALSNGHDALCHHVGDVVGHVLSSSFDAVLLDIWGALMHGATVFLPSLAACRSAGHLLEGIADIPLTTLPITSGLLHQLVQVRPDAFATITNLWFGGEAADPNVLAALRSAPTVLVHHYGPTECTSIATVHIVAGGEDPKRAVPIGRPLRTVKLYLLDEDLEPVADGETGEIFLGGVQVSRGYLSRPRLTACQFVPDPFGSTAGQRLYRTGDLARRLPDGEIEFIGRQDDQVKVRGFRVEPAEVTAALRSIPKVVDAVVVASGHGTSERRLIAYLVAPETNKSEVRAALERMLPEFMVPSSFVFLDALPMLPNQKIDQQALQALERTPSAELKETGASDLERRLMNIWCDILEVPNVSVTDDFFELGGYSLLAAHLAVRIEESFAVTVPLRSLFEARTVRELATVVERATRSVKEVSPSPMTRSPSSGQRELWFLDRLNPGSSAYNSPIAFRLRGHLNVSALQRAVEEVTRRHEVLRWSFPSHKGKPQVNVAQNSRLPLPVDDLEQNSAVTVKDAIEEWAVSHRIEPFNLAIGPLIRTRLLRIAEDDFAVLVTVHHTVFDGWSYQVFVAEIGELYRAFATNCPSPLPELTVHYADVVWREQQQLDAGECRSQLDYWSRQLADAPQSISLPSAGHSTDDLGAATARSLIPANLATAIRSLTSGGGPTPFMFLLSALGVTLYKLTGDADMVIVCPHVGRRGSGVSELIGHFVQVLPLRLSLSEEQTAGELLSAVRETAVTAFENQDVPFGRIVQEVSPARSSNERSPYSQIAFNMVDLKMPVVALDGIDAQPIHIETSEPRFPLAIIVKEENHAYSVEVHCDARTVDPNVAPSVASMLPLVTELALRRPDLSVGTIMAQVQ